MSQQPKQKEDEEQQVPLEQIPINNFPTALSIVYQYLNLASKRGAFQLQESAKAMACLDYMSRVVKPAGTPNSSSDSNGSNETNTENTNVAQTANVVRKKN